MNCPECGSESVSIDTVGENLPPTRSLQDHVLRAAEGDSLEFVRTCWTCGWEERRGLEVTDIQVDSGDETIQQKQSLLEEIQTIAEEIDDLETLQQTVTELRQLRDDTGD